MGKRNLCFILAAMVMVVLVAVVVPPATVKGSDLSCVDSNPVDEGQADVWNQANAFMFTNKCGYDREVEFFVEDYQAGVTVSKIVTIKAGETVTVETGLGNHCGQIDWDAAGNKTFNCNPTSTASSTPSATPTLEASETPTPSETPDATETVEPSQTPEISSTPSATPTTSSTPEVSSTPSATPTGDNTPTATASVTPTVTPTTTPVTPVTPTPTPGKPDQGECTVGNGANLPLGVTGGDKGMWWMTAKHLMPTGKEAVAVELHFANANVAGQTFTVSFNGGSEQVLVKDLDTTSADRCEVVGDPVAIPFAEPQPLIMDMGEGGWMQGQPAGEATVDGKPFAAQEFIAHGTVSQMSGVLAIVSTSGRTYFGWHYTDVPRTLEVGTFITVGKKTYEVKATWEIEKNEILSLPKGVYGVSCTSDLVRNRIYQLELVK